MMHHRYVLLERLVQVCKRSILITETRVNDREVVRRYVTLLRRLVLAVENLQSFITFAGHGISVCQYGVSIPSFRSIVFRIRNNFLHLSDGFRQHAFSHISYSDMKVAAIWSAFSRGHSCSR